MSMPPGTFNVSSKMPREEERSLGSPASRGKKDEKHESLGDKYTQNYLDSTAQKDVKSNSLKVSAHHHPAEGISLQPEMIASSSEAEVSRAVLTFASLYASVMQLERLVDPGDHVAVRGVAKQIQAGFESTPDVNADALSKQVCGGRISSNQDSYTQWSREIRPAIVRNLENGKPITQLVAVTAALIRSNDDFPDKKVLIEETPPELRTEFHEQLDQMLVRIDKVGTETVLKPTISLGLNPSPEFGKMSIDLGAVRDGRALLWIHRPAGSPDVVNLFDNDGTIAKTTHKVDHIFVQVIDHEIKKRGGGGLSREEYDKRFSGIVVETILESLSNEQGFSLSEEDKSQVATTALDELVRSFKRDNDLEATDFSLEAIKALRKSGSRCAMATSAPANYARNILETLHEPKLFGDYIFSGVDMEKPKPDPAVYNAAKKALGVVPEDIVVTWEDSGGGMESSRRASSDIMIGVIGSGEPDEKLRIASKLVQRGATIIVDSFANGLLALHDKGFIELSRHAEPPA